MEAGAFKPQRTSPKRDNSGVCCDVFSGNLRYSLVCWYNDYPDYIGSWIIGGGKAKDDNLNGEYFLKMPLSNFIRGSEARLFVPKPTKVITAN